MEAILPCLPPEMWGEIMSHTCSAKDAASLAHMCRNARQALRESKWKVGVRISATGNVYPPLCGFNAVVKPGEDVQVAVDSVPNHGAILLAPGEHAGPVKLGDIGRDRVVHIFGEGRATLRANPAFGAALFSNVKESTVVGVKFRGDALSANIKQALVNIYWGALRIQDCDLSIANYPCVHITMGKPSISRCRMHDSRFGITTGVQARPLINDNTITGISRTGIHLLGSAVMNGNTIRGNPGTGLHGDDNATITGQRLNVIEQNGRNVSGLGGFMFVQEIAHRQSVDANAEAYQAAYAMIDELVLPKLVSVIEATSRIRKVGPQLKKLLRTKSGSFLVAPGFYAIPAGHALRDIRYFGRGRVTFFMCGSISTYGDVLLDGIQVVHMATARPTAPVRANVFNVVSGRLQLQACAVLTCGDCVTVQSKAAATVLACSIQGPTGPGTCCQFVAQSQSQSGDDASAKTTSYLAGNAISDFSTGIRVQRDHILHLSQNHVVARWEGVFADFGAVVFIDANNSIDEGVQGAVCGPGLVRVSGAPTPGEADGLG